MSKNVKKEALQKENAKLKKNLSAAALKLSTKSRKLQVEAALEKVRVIAMRMQAIDDLPGICEITYKQLVKLGFSELRNTMINMYGDGKDSFINYDYAPSTGQTITTIPFDMHPFITQDAQIIRKSNKSFNQFSFSGKELKKFREIRKKNGEADDPRLDNTPELTYYFYSVGTASIGISAYSPIDAEKLSVLKRFRNVFDFAYRRYLDVSQAMATAREAKIEASLEKVRSRSMGMQKSEELKDVIQVVFKEMVQLKIHADHAGFVVDYSPKGDWHFWIADKNEIPSKITHPYFDSIWAKQFNAAKENGIDFFTTLLSFEEKNAFYSELFKYVPGLPEQSRAFYFSCPGLAASNVIMENVALYIENFDAIPYTNEENNILKRFGKVFQQTYTRFLDLQKAEAQTREAEIELSLERVRSKAMAMHISADILSTTTAAFEELKKLGIHSLRCGIGLLSNAHMDAHVYALATDTNGELQTLAGVRNMNEHPSLIRQYRAWLQQENIVEEMNGEELRSYYNKLFFTTSANSTVPENFDNKQYGYYFSFADGLFYSWTDRAYTEKELDILHRFNRIVALTFRRFLDLVKAEAQSREATIEVSLERVRSSAMAMHNSSDLSATINIFFKELKHLGIVPVRCGVGVIDAVDKISNMVATTSIHQGETVETIGKLKLQGHPVLDQIFSHWESQQEYFPVLEGEEIKKYYNVMNRDVNFPDWTSDTIQYGNYFYFKEGLVFAWTNRILNTEEISIFRRFTTVIALTFRRYIDLQKAEAQAREAQIEAALEKVRSVTLGLKNSEDMLDIAQSLYEQLLVLGFTEIRNAIIDIHNDEDETFMDYDYSHDMSGTVTKMSYYDDPIIEEQVRQIESSNDAFFELILEGERLQTLIDLRIKNGEKEDPRLNNAQQLTYNLYSFGNGAIGISNFGVLTTEQKEVLKRFRNVFTFAYKRYTDLAQAEKLARQAQIDLENLIAAKKKTDDALTELKTTQKQLIQSEKMASLGELTAGIAHEIQNPLNFVNNFSEVSSELIDEMNAELDNGDIEEAKTIAFDIKQNLEKINHHGKRADAIVKGMLQHSRSSSGKKEPVDINALCDEYLRLAYHGMRAKDKSFNANFKTDFDHTLDKIQVAPQDIGRVILNIINNAFYAVNEKAKQHIPEYEPTVAITTKKINGKVKMSISDNGNGIPETIKEKIFQPFFTTKPTGQGTGLGLSLSYDIIKAHDGELKVESTENTGTEFIILLPLE